MKKRAWIAVVLAMLVGVGAGAAPKDDAVRRMFKAATPVADVPVIEDSLGCLWEITETKFGVNLKRVYKKSGVLACRNFPY